MIMRRTCCYQRSQGAVLIVALLLLLAMTIIGVSAIDTTTMESLMSRNSQEANTRYQVTVNEIEGHIRYTAQSAAYRERIVTSNYNISSTTTPGVSQDGVGLVLASTSGPANAPLQTEITTDHYTLSGYVVFSDFYTGAHHGFSLGKTKQVPIELNIHTALDGTKSFTDHTQAVLFPAPGEG